MTTNDDCPAESVAMADVDLETLQHLDGVSGVSMVWWLQRADVNHTFSRCFGPEVVEVRTPLMDTLDQGLGERSDTVGDWTESAGAAGNLTLAGEFEQPGVGTFRWSVRLYPDAVAGRPRAAHVLRSPESRASEHPPEQADVQPAPSTFEVDAHDGDWAVRFWIAPGSLQVRCGEREVTDEDSIHRLAGMLDFRGNPDAFDQTPRPDDERLFAELGIDLVLQLDGAILGAIEEKYWARHLSVNLLVRMADQLRLQVASSLFRYHAAHGHELEFLDRAILHWRTDIFSCEVDAGGNVHFNRRVRTGVPSAFFRPLRGHLLEVEGRKESNLSPDTPQLTMRDVEVVYPGEFAIEEMADLGPEAESTVPFGTESRMVAPMQFALHRHRRVRWTRIYQSRKLLLSTETTHLAIFHPPFQTAHVIDFERRIYLNSNFFHAEQLTEFESAWERMAVWWRQPGLVHRRSQRGKIDAPGPSTPIEWLVAMTLLAPDLFLTAKHCDAVWRSTPFRAHPSFAETFPDKSTCFRIVREFDHHDLMTVDFRADLIFCERLNLPELFHAARPAGAARAPADAVLLVATVVEHGPDADEPCE